MNNILKYGLLVLAIFVSIATLKAQETLTIEQCRSNAIEYNKQLKKAKYQQDEAKEYQKVARTAYLPALSADASVMHLAKAIDVNMPGGFLPTANSEADALAGNWSGVSDVYSPGMAFKMDNLTMLNGGVSLNQPLFTGGKIMYANKQADLGVQMAEYGYKLKYDEVIELTDQVFWQVAMVLANIDLAESYIEMLLELEEQLISMYDLGLSPASEKLKVSVQKNEAELQLLKARNGLKIAKMYLNQVTGRDLSAEVNISYGEMVTNIFDLSNGVESALANRSEIKLMESQVKMAGYQKALVRAEYLPMVGISAQYSTVYVNDILEDMEASPMLAGQITIPLFAWGQGKRKQQAAEFVIKQKQEELDRTNDLISLEVLQVSVQVQEAYEAIAIAKKNIVEAEQSLDETKASFEVGLNTTTEMLNAQADWQKANVQLITATAQFKVLETSWLKVIGNLNY